MATIYNRQDLIRIESTYDSSPGTISKAYIKYRKPSGGLGQFIATLDEENNMFYYIPKKGEYLEAGVWTVWNYAILEDGRGIPGEPWCFTVYEEGKPYCS